MSIDSDVIRGHVDTIILKTLITGDKYGYEIIKEIEQKSKGTYELKQPTLYSSLKRLEKQGLISAFWKNSDIGGKRHYYKLTKKGRETYESSMQEWFNSRSIIDSLMGSKPTSLTMAEEDEDLPIIEETFKMLEESEDAETSPLDEVQENTQMVLDDSSNITEATEPRDFDIENLDEDEVALLGDYYKTDENQINLFGSTDTVDNQDEYETDESVATDDSAEPEDDDKVYNIDYSHPFKNYEGADVSKYRQNNKDNYFEKIPYGVADANNVDVTHDEEEEPDESVVSNAKGVSNFNFFTSFPTDEEIEKEDDEDSNELDILSNDDFSTEDEDENLNFGFGYSNEEVDEMELPHNFSSVNLVEEENGQQDPAPSISIYGEEDESNIEENYYSYNNEEPSSYDYEPYEPTDLKPYNIGTYTEPHYKEKLNQLSSYTKNNYETIAPSGFVDTMNVEARSITELKSDLEQDGINVRSYKRPEKEALHEKKYLLVNKIKFVTSWIVFAIMSGLLLVTYFIAKSVGYTDFTYIDNALPVATYFILAGVAVLIVPIVYTVIYFLNKTKKVKPNYSVVISLIFALLFFIVCLNIIYTLNILNGFTKFTQKDYNHLLWLLPCVVSLLIIFQSAVYSLLFKTKRFNA